MTAGPAVDAASRLRFAPHVRFLQDRVRDRWVIQAPERVLLPDEIAVEVLRRLDGQAAVGDIAAALAQEFDAPYSAILSDVTALLQDLTDKGVLAP